MNFRPYEAEKDKKAAHRIWREVGWVSDESEEKGMDIFLSEARVLVADINNEPECLVLSLPGSIRYQEDDLKFSAISGVTTSHVGRKQGFASYLTAQLIAQDVADGALVSGLGMFEQGFYNKLGFGTGCYENWVSFDPAQLAVTQKASVPRRLNKDDWQIVHQALLNRYKGHGGINILPATSSQAEMHWTSKGFGLGYNDGPEGELSHFLWLAAKGEHGPYNVNAIAYQNWEQFLELLALLKNLGDQVRMVNMMEPRQIQLQDLLKQPFRHRQLTSKSPYENITRATAYWQLRICDLSQCLARTHLAEPSLKFNLQLSDPIENYLPAEAPWRGVSGNYVITLGADSGAELGSDASLPTLTASVGAFTRLWMGVLNATSLSITDDLAGPADLLQALDKTVRLPLPQLGWDF